MEEHAHTWVAGMMYVSDEDLADTAQKRRVECEHCDGAVKVSWHIEFADRVSTTVYSEELARNIASGKVDPQRFVPGEVTSVTRHVVLRTGSHDDHTRRIEYLSSLPIDFAVWQGAAPLGDFQAEPFKPSEHESGKFVCVGRNRKCGIHRTISSNGYWVRYDDNSRVWTSAHRNCI